MATKPANKAWQERNRKYPGEWYRQRVASDPRYAMSKNIKRKYNMTLDMYDAMVEAQNGKCAICGEEKKLYIDHDHDTGAPRKLLCALCNTGLGRFKDRKDLLEKAVEYMAQFDLATVSVVEE